MKNVGYLLVLLIFASGCATNSRNLSQALGEENSHSRDLITVEEVVFDSEGVPLSGSIYIPKNAQAAVVLVHGSDPVPRMSKLAESLAKHDLLVLTYDKRGVGESGGVYVGPQVGTNNISVDNLTLLAKDASAAVDVVHEYDNSLSIGLLGASQAGWIIPITALNNQSVEFMVLFSSPTITTLEQLRFQFYTNGREDFWQTQSNEEAREHTLNDPDKYEFNATDPKVYLDSLSIPGLWLFGEQDIQVPVKMCVEQLNELKAQGKPFEYVLFPSLGHNTNKAEPLAIAIHWIEQKYASN
ncbi:alpha/beta hydrolase family protein [Pseudoalteromonas ruthenica]|uniref:alpha/beta hydrolase family protein n=1 Tax=Pseudoalteromonas ruthenica TaxID=151081 RepID=UPI00241F0B6A|nr:alpha/beta hydrolase [Pseudoalteromonas ruthenica]